MTNNKREFHEAADIFPLDEEHLDELAGDILKNGQQVAIEIFDGQILDGRRRYLACNKAGVTPRFIEVDVTDPVTYVASLNLHRRHLTPSQRSMCAARAKTLTEKYQAEAKERQRAGGEMGRQKQKGLVGNCPQALTDAGAARDKIGQMFGVDGRAVGSAQKVLRDGVPELAKAVDEGRMGVRTAADLASEPEEVQRHATQFIPDGRARNRKYKPPTNGNGKPILHNSDKKEDSKEIEVQGVGVMRAHEAINCLKRIPKNDGLRKRGFQIVKDWIRHNQ